MKKHLTLLFLSVPPYLSERICSAVPQETTMYGPPLQSSLGVGGDARRRWTVPSNEPACDMGRGANGLLIHITPPQKK